MRRYVMQNFTNTYLEQTNYACSVCQSSIRAIAKMTKIFWSISVHPWLLFPKFLMGFFPIVPMNMRTKLEVRSFARSLDIKGTPKIWISPPPFSPQFLTELCSHGSCECTGQI